MAVVQISKIQHRRGRKLEGTGLPQLASAELGWAIDTQELYIGNGAVSEGAPYVGNTKVLTEHDDLFQLTSSYEYRGGDVANTAPRSLQSKLDESVSVFDFGAVGDGVQDDTAAIQNAIDQIYLTSTSTKDIVELRVPAGTYLISQRLEIPPNCKLIGEGVGKSIIRQIGADFILRTVNGESIPGTYLTDQGTSGDVSDAIAPSNIVIENITFETTSSTYHGFMLNYCRDSFFNNIAIVGPWTTGNNTILTDGSTLNYAIEFVSFSNSVFCNNLTFSDVRISNFPVGPASKYDIENIRFRDSRFYQLGFGMLWGRGTAGNISGEREGPKNIVVENSVFEQISREAILQENGFGLLSYSNRYTKVGNMGGGESANVTSVLKLDSGGGISSNDYFDRRKTLSDLENTLTLQVKQAANIGATTINVQHTVNDIEDYIGRQFLYNSTLYTITSYTLGNVTNGDTVGLNTAITATTIPSGTILSSNYNFSNYIPEVLGPAKVEHCHAIKASLETASNRALIKLPGNYTATHEITFHYSSTENDATYNGVITATLNTDQTPQVAECSYTYDFSGTAGNETKLSFGVEVGDYDSNNLSDALEINYTNTLDNDAGILYYTIRSFTKA
jgi:hypothetical protein